MNGTDCFARRRQRDILGDWSLGACSVTTVSTKLISALLEIRRMFGSGKCVIASGKYSSRGEGVCSRWCRVVPTKRHRSGKKQGSIRSGPYVIKSRLTRQVSSINLGAKSGR